MSQTNARRRLGEILRAAHAAARHVDDIRASAYHVLPPGVSCKADWAGWADPLYEPTPRQQAMLDVLQDLLDGGATCPVRLAVAAGRRLKCSRADILRSRVNIGEDGESAHFFDDVMHALYLLDAQETEGVFYGLMDRLVQR
jgi:hypothetical protein